MSAPRRRRVLIIVENLPVPFDTRVWNEATALTAAGYEVSVVCPIAHGHSARFEIIDGVSIYRHPLPAAEQIRFGYAVEYAAAIFWQVVLAWRVWRTRGFDVIHACNPPDTIFLVALPYQLLAGTRLVFDHHDLSPELYAVKFGRRDAVYRLLLRLERWSVRAADVVIATNESYRRNAIERNGAAPHRVHIVRSGPNPERMRILPPDPALRGGRRHLVAYVGIMGRQDGIHHLLDAVRHVVHDRGRRDVHFALVGGGPELDALRGRSVTLGVDAWVTFTGWAGDDTLLAVLNTADVCVNADDVNELSDQSTMIKVMEYMALGKPIVQFDTREGRRSAEGAAVYARPNDPRDLAEKLLELLDDPERRAAMGACGLERVRSELAWPRQAVKLLDAYDAAFGDPS